MRLLKIDDKEYSIPGAWNELSKDQLLEVCRIMLLPLDENYKKIMLVGYFTGINFKLFSILPVDALPDIVGTVNYLFLPSRLTINNLPEIFGMIGPEHALTNLTFEQFFNEAESYYYLSCKNKDGKNLDKLINTLYNYKGSAENESKLIGLFQAEKLAIFLFYEGCSNFIKNKFREVFKNGESKKPDGLEFTRLINSLNNNDISRNEQIKNTNLYEALIHLQTIIQTNGPE